MRQMHSSSNIPVGNWSGVCEYIKVIAKYCPSVDPDRRWAMAVKCVESELAQPRLELYGVQDDLDILTASN